ncbi:MAG: polynucleotide adenylyltransferase PcnB [Spirochaetaceae bacterium]|nr:polynucleotide adenylyltransferase PcnB [Spirochaetaceae bacterium]
MLVRYGRDQNGKPVPQALVYTEQEHGIQLKLIDPDAIRIVEKLKKSGHKAYIVGGAVRDLMLGSSPKDFDLVTNALPNEIRKLFRNSRIIGRRFRLVHIFYGPKIFEVSTFRSNKNGSVGNEFGTMAEDVTRRDFTLNALYFDPTDSTLVDFVGGVKDIRAGKLTPIIPLDRIFKEDPVRIVRGVKYAAMTGFSMSFSLKRAIRKEASLLSVVSHSRMTEEFFKILASGKSEPILRQLSEFNLIQYFVPKVWERMQADIEYSKKLFSDLRSLDALHIDVRPSEIEGKGSAEDLAQSKKKLSVLLSYFLESYVEAESKNLPAQENIFSVILASARDFVMPLNPPRIELEEAIKLILEELGLAAKPRAPRKRPRKRSAKSRADSRPQAHPEPQSAQSGGMGESSEVT